MSDSFSWLPVGYMIPFSGTPVPNDFIEVDGQQLSKTEHRDVFDNFRGKVVESGDCFTLPLKKDLRKLFLDKAASSTKIILKLR